MKHISHNTKTLTVGGIIDQDQLKIGTTGGSVAGIFFDNGKVNLPGIRYNKETSQWESSVDGITWKSFASKGSIPYEVIDITSTELTNGVATIQHNLGVKYPLGLGFTVVPDGIEYMDINTLKLDYGSHALANFQAKVWFYNSKQSMLIGGASSNEA